MMRNFLTIMAFLAMAIGCENGEGITDQSEREEDEQFLETLYQEIVELSESIPCVDAEQWEFTAIGSKACGGPVGYIAYPTTINVEDFLDRVVLYTEQQRIFNEKWEINSTCDIPAEPSDVICQDGKPFFIYASQ